MGNSLGLYDSREIFQIYLIENKPLINKKNNILIKKNSLSSKFSIALQYNCLKKVSLAVEFYTNASLTFQPFLFLFQIPCSQNEESSKQSITSIAWAQ